VPFEVLKKRRDNLMKKKIVFLFAIMALIVIVTSFSEETYAFRDLTRKEAETLYLAAYHPKELACIFFTIGKWVTSVGVGEMGREREVYIKLRELGLIRFEESPPFSNLSSASGRSRVYNSEITEKGKSEIMEVGEGLMKFLDLPDFGAGERKWYSIQMFALKFLGCGGIRN
jgi:hypothetical protein